MLSIDPALPVLRIDPALPMDRTEPALPMLRTLPKLRMLPTLQKHKTLNQLLALSKPARLPVLMRCRPRLRLGRVDLPMIDSPVLDTSLLINASVERLTASLTLSPRRIHTVATTAPACGSLRRLL